MAIATIPQRAMSEQGFSFRNLLINGDMSIAQRGTSFTGLGVGDGGYHTVDRFQFLVSDTPTYEFTMTQDSDVPTGQGFAKSMKLACTTAQASLGTNNALRFSTILEGQMLQHLKFGTSNAESLTLSFWVKSNKTGDYSVALYNADSVDIITRTISIDVSDTWEKKTLTFSGDTTNAFNNDNGASLYLWITLLAGTSYNTSSAVNWTSYAAGRLAYGQTVNLADSISNYINITGVQLEVGTSASDFEFLPFDVNLRRCYRYYEKSYDYETAPATNTEVSSMAINGLDQGTKQLRSVPVKHLETKRATPTITIYDVPGNSGKINTLDQGGTTATNQSFNGVIANGKNSFNWYIGSTDKEVYIYHYTADAEL